MADEEKLSSIANLVPEIFYDLICRVPPGTALALFAMWLFDMFKIYGVFSVDKIITFKFAPLVILFQLLIGLGYVIGIILTPIGDLLHRISRRCEWKEYSSLPDERKTWVNNAFRSLNIPYNFPTDRIDKNNCYRELHRNLHDFLKTENQQAKQVLAKMGAEAQLCHNLAAALIIMILISAFVPNWPWTITLSSLQLICFLLVISAFVIWAGYYRQRRFIGRQLSFLLLVLSAKLRDRNPEQDEAGGIILPSFGFGGRGR